MNTLKIKFWFLFLCFLFLGARCDNFLYVKNESRIKIAFGSVNNPVEGGSEIFESIEKYDPDIFIWLGKQL